MPHKGESASFFSLHFYCNVQAGIPPILPPPSFLRSRRSPPPLLRPESWAGEVSTLEPKLCTSSKSPRRRATAGERERRWAPGRRPAHPQRLAPARAELTEEPGAAAAAAAPGPINSKCSRLAGEEEEALRCSRPGNGCRDRTPPAALSSRGPRERAGSGRTEGAPRKPARRAAASSPALRLCAASGPGTQVRWHSSAEGHRARRPLEQSQSARQRHTGCREKGSVSGSREGRKPPGQRGRTRAPRELRAEPRIVRFLQALGLSPST